jgi:hypothetical protein
MRRFTVTNLLVLIALVGVGLGAMRDGSEWTTKAVYTLTLLALLVGLLGAIVRRQRAAWVGFALFGWTYAAVVLIPPVKTELQPYLLATSLMDQAVDRLLNLPPSPGELPKSPIMYEVNGKLTEASKVAFDEWNRMVQEYNKAAISRSSITFPPRARIDYAKPIGNLFLALIFGFVGAILGRFMASWRTSRRTNLSSGPKSPSEASPLTS